MFDFKDVRQGTTAWQELKIQKCCYIIDAYEAGKSVLGIRDELGIDNTKVIINRISRHNVYKDNGKIVDKEFYRTFCGELYDYLYKNDITSFKELENVLKYDPKLSKIRVNNPFFKPVIINIYEKWAKKNVKKKTKKGSK